MFRKTQTQISPAFTLLELLVVLVVVALLAALLFPVLARSKAKAQQAACRTNLRELGFGFQLYHADFDDQFPGPGSADQYGPQPEDWIWWQYGRGVAKSTIGKYVGLFTPGLFTCPADRRAKTLQAQEYLRDEPYRYSYALTSFDLTNGINPGMATIITQDRVSYPFKVTSIRNLNLKMMLVEEGDQTIDDPRWVPVGRGANLVSGRHRGKGDITFADGHVDAVTPGFGTNLLNSIPTY